MNPLVDSEAPDAAARGPAHFVTTHWSAVLAAAGEDSPTARQALTQLCQAYWFPLYAFVRRSGHSQEDAEDLTQGFFERAIANNYFAQADRTQGRFRAFLLACLKHFMADARDRQRAAKRGGGQPLVSFDALTAEEHYRGAPKDDLSPDRLYDLQWARTVAEQARARLRQEYTAAGKATLYDLLNKLEPGAGKRLAYAEVARLVNKTEVAVKNEASRLHQRYAQLLRAEVAQTVATVAEVDAELRYLIQLLQT